MTVPTEYVRSLLRLPWNILVSRDGGDLEARVTELPSVIATGADERALMIDLYEALRATLESHVEHDDPIPLPAGCKAPCKHCGGTGVEAP